MDTLIVAKQLKTYGFNEQQAEGLAGTLHDAIESKAATKDDLLAVRSELKQDILQVELRLEKSMFKYFLLYCGFLGSIAGALAWFISWKFK